MKSFIVGLCGAGMLTAAAIAAQNETTVTLTGCVEKATQADTYVLTHLTESVAGSTAQSPSVIYWLSTTKGLKDQIGHTVQVTGTVRPEDEQGKMGKLKAEADGITGETKLAVERGTKKAEVVNTDMPIGTSGTITKLEMDRPSLKLYVKTLTMIAPSCRVGA